MQKSREAVSDRPEKHNKKHNKMYNKNSLFNKNFLL
nr:MAG TPA: hypothetical protein [Caudoviricetes sp.]